MRSRHIHRGSPSTCVEAETRGLRSQVGTWEPQEETNGGGAFLSALGDAINIQTVGSQIFPTLAVGWAGTVWGGKRDGDRTGKYGYPTC
jgi:hypothetical protein